MPRLRSLRRPSGGLAALAAALWLAACAAPPAGPVAEIARSGVLACFAPAPLVQGRPARTCEPSAALALGDTVLVANDNEPRGLAAGALFMAPAAAFDRPAPRLGPFPFPPTLRAAKFEALAALPEGWVVAATAFDRIRPDGAEWDPFNALIAWPTGRPAAAALVAPSVRGGVESSAGLRAVFRRALRSAAFPDGPPFFKIEGLAAHDGALLFGVREIGETFRDPTQVVIVLALPYAIQGGRVVLGGEARIAWRMPSRHPEIADPAFGLSDFVSDPPRGRFLLLTGVERDGPPPVLAGHLWELTVQDFAAGRPARLARGADGAPLRFAHKPEGLSVLADGRLLIVHDDDKHALPVRDPASGAPRPRSPEEAAFDIVLLR